MLTALPIFHLYRKEKKMPTGGNTNKMGGNRGNYGYNKSQQQNYGHQGYHVSVVCHQGYHVSVSVVVSLYLL